MGEVKVGVTTRTESMKFVPCIKCGGEDVNFYDCGYSTFNPYLAECKCGHKLKEMDTSIRSIVIKWNQENDAEYRLEIIKNKMDVLKAEAKSLKKIISARKRKESQNGN